MRRRLGRAVPAAVAALLVGLLAGLLTGCGHADQGGNADPAQLDATNPPKTGACRVLTADDLTMASNATRTVDCTKDHTALTYAVGTVPDDVAGAGEDSGQVAAFAYQTCSARLDRYLGADESTSMRTILTWAWFRPSAKAWDEGARWYRCDVVAGGADGAPLMTLPTTVKGLLAGRPDDAWMACVQGAGVDGAPKIPCTEPHDWRAVTTIKLGEPGDAYPGDRVSEVRTRDYCSQSVAAWLDYPASYDYGYTWFHQAEWDAGNRRSVCWARTDQ